VSVGSLTNKKIPYANASKILTDSQITQEADGTVVISNDVEISGSLLVSGESFEVVRDNSLSKIVSLISPTITRITTLILVS
jgi:hypothetical protein